MANKETSEDAGSQIEDSASPDRNLDEDDSLIAFTVDEINVGVRVDAAVAELAGISRAQVKRWVEAGRVRVADEPVRASRKLVYGEWVEAEPIELVETELIAEAIPLDVLFEDEHLIVINKPAGLVVHPAPGHPNGTLVNALLHHCGDLAGIGGVLRPGIVHRLDKDTSGLMLAAKNDYSHRHLAAQFADHTLDRAYLALVWGVVSPNQGKISGNIGRNPGNRKKMAVVPYGGKTALTSYKLQKALGDWASLVECRLATGRTHQIRVHMTSIGHSVIGDNLYGSGIKSAITKRAPEFSERAAKLDRHALHAYLLGFIHPRTGKRLRFEIKLAKDIKALL